MMAAFAGDEYTLLGVINRGSFGVVYKALDKATNDTVAIKEELRGLSHSTMTEIKILDSLPRHPNIVEFKQALSDGGGRIFMVMEYLQYDLKRLRERMGKPFPLGLIKTLMREILNGVAFLHEKGVIHRDLKPGNVLFGSGDGIKICDFGLSARVGSLWGSGVGTRLYKAPEILDGCEDYESKVDLWSAGCMMAEFVLDKPLFCGRSDVDQLACIRGALLSESGLDLLEKLLGYYPWERERLKMFFSTKNLYVYYSTININSTSCKHSEQQIQTPV